MQFTVTIPDTADEAVIQTLAEAVAAAGGTVEPVAPNPMEAPGAPALNPMEQGMEMPPVPPMDQPLPAGPGAGLLPGAAMAEKGARALRPRPPRPGY